MGASAPPRPAKKRRSSGVREEKPPLSEGSVARWKDIDPQLFDPDFAKQLIGMYERHVEGLPAPEISRAPEAGSSGTPSLDAAPAVAEPCQHLHMPPGARSCHTCGERLPVGMATAGPPEQPPPEPAGSSGEAASSSLPEPAEPPPPAPSPPEPSPPAPSLPEPATDVWLPARSYENTEDAITDRVISLMQEHEGPFTIFTMGMTGKTDAAGGLAAHRAMRAQLQHEASKLPGGLNDANFAVVCSATLAHADATHIINAGSRAEYTTVDEDAEPPQVPAPLFSQTLHVTLEDDPEDVVRLSRGGGGRAFSQQELEAVRNDPKLPPCTKALIELATASTIPGWHPWTLAVTRNLPCLMQQWRVVDGPAVAPVQRGVEFPTRGITGAQEAEVFRAPSTVKGRLGVQAAYFHVLGFDWQFCCLPVFALVRFGVVVGNPQHGGDAHVIAIDRHGEVIQHQSVAGTLGGALPLLAPLTHRQPRTPLTHRRRRPPRRAASPRTCHARHTHDPTCARTARRAPHTCHARIAGRRGPRGRSWLTPCARFSLRAATGRLRDRRRR